MIRRRAATLIALLGLAAIPSCGPKNFANQNDELRREREDLRAQIASLELQLAETKARVASLTPQASDASGHLDPAEVADASPVCVTLEIDRYSGLRDTSEDGSPDLLIVRIRTLDGRARFTQVVGKLDVSAELVRVDAPSAPVGAASLGPSALREAYRSGFGGTWYAVDIPVAIEEFRPGDQLMIKARLERADGGTADVVRILDGVGDRWVASKKNP